MSKTDPFRSTLLIISVCVLFSASCSKSKDKDDDKNANWMRLKHLSSVDAVRDALGGFISSYSTSTDAKVQFSGDYPDGDYQYSYDVKVTKTINASITDTRVVHGRANYGDESKSGRLGQMYAVEINNGELGQGKYSNVVAMRFESNRKANWRFELFIDLNHINKEDQVIVIEGGHHKNLSPQEEAAAPEVPTDAEIISTMLRLIEQGKE